jgi:hypothetical protein
MRSLAFQGNEDLLLQRAWAATLFAHIIVPKVGLSSILTSASFLTILQARLKAAELDRTSAERRAATAEREVVTLRRQLEEAAADTEEVVQGALAEAHEAFDAEVGSVPSRRPPPLFLPTLSSEPLFGPGECTMAELRKKRIYYVGVLAHLNA